MYFTIPTRELRAAMRDGEFGAMLTRAQGIYQDLDGVPLIIDNGKFGNGWTGGADFLAFVGRAADRYPGQARFAVAPDVPGDAGATLAESAPYYAAVRAMGVRVALAAQNGLTPGMVPWDDIDVIFLAGCPECIACGFVRPVAEFEVKRCPGCGCRLAEWKLGLAAAELGAEAIRRGREVHGARVNSGRRVAYMESIGCTTADGTFPKWSPRTNLPRMRRWFTDMADNGVQGVLGGAA